MIRTIINHVFNPLHVFCRLRDLGISKSRARWLCSIHEQWIYRPLILKGGETMESLLFWLSTVKVDNVVKGVMVGVIALAASFLLW